MASAFPPAPFGACCRAKREKSVRCPKTPAPLSMAGMARVTMDPEELPTDWMVEMEKKTRKEQQSATGIRLPLQLSERGPTKKEPRNPPVCHQNSQVEVTRAASASSSPRPTLR